MIGISVMRELKQFESLDTEHRSGTQKVYISLRDPFREIPRVPV